MTGQVVQQTVTSSPATFTQALPAGSVQQFRVTAQGPGGNSSASALSSTKLTIPGTAPKYAYARGVNSAGADFGSRNSPTIGKYDSDASFAFYKQRGCTMIRIPWLWEHMQPTLNGALNTTELGRLQAAVNSVTSRGMIANIDCHNYCRYTPSSGSQLVMASSGGLTGANLADLWTKLAAVFKSNPRVHFGLMNEPHDLASNSVWEQAANLTVNAIRAAGATNWCWVGGMIYSSAPAYWSQHPTWFIKDPLNRSGPEGHYYFDNPPSGTYNTSYAAAVSAANGNLPNKTSNDIGGFCKGARSRGLVPYVGETGWKNSGSDLANWNAAGEALYKAADASGAYMTYWAAGEAWGGGYALSVYSGTPESVVCGVASVVEAHPGSLVDPGGASI